MGDNSSRRQPGICRAKTCRPVSVLFWVPLSFSFSLSHTHKRVEMSCRPGFAFGSAHRNLWCVCVCVCEKGPMFAPSDDSGVLRPRAVAASCFFLFERLRSWVSPIFAFDFPFFLCRSSSLSFSLSFLSSCLSCRLSSMAHSDATCFTGQEKLILIPVLAVTESIDDPHVVREGREGKKN